MKCVLFIFAMFISGCSTLGALDTLTGYAPNLYETQTWPYKGGVFDYARAGNLNIEQFRRDGGLKLASDFCGGPTEVVKESLTENRQKRVVSFKCSDQTSVQAQK